MWNSSWAGTASPSRIIRSWLSRLAEYTCSLLPHMGEGPVVSRQCVLNRSTIPYSQGIFVESGNKFVAKKFFYTICNYKIAIYSQGIFVE